MLHRKIPILAVSAGLALLLASCAGAPPPARFAIGNLQYGPLCGSPEGEKVCTQSSDVEITGKGRCVYDKREIPCTWYGFSFDYAPKEGVEIDCDMVMDRTTNMGNPQGIVAKDASSMHYQIDLRGEGGHHVQAQYAGSEGFKGVEQIKQICSYEGEKLFEVVLRLHQRAVAS